MKLNLSEVKIDKGIKIPCHTVAGLINKMGFGDSVFFKEVRKAHSFATRIRQLRYKSAYKKVNKGFRVWKLENHKNTHTGELRKISIKL